MSSIYDAMLQHKEFDIIAKEISNKMNELTAEIQSQSQPTKYISTDDYFESTLIVIRDSICRLKDSFSKSSEVITKTMDKKVQEIKELEDQYNSLFASVQFVKGDTSRHSYYDQFLVIQNLKEKPECDFIQEEPFVPFEEEMSTLA